MGETRIYGEHDAKTLAQLDRCMTVGSAVKGVLCADGHLGYAHPIGGVVAYEDPMQKEWQDELERDEEPNL